MPQPPDPLLIEANRINYRLRSTFFYHKMKEYNVLAFSSLVANLFAVEHLYNWDERANWGIDEDAFEYVSQHTILKLIQVFCHPRLLREHPALLAYYRNIAALSQKSVGYLTGISVTQYETHPDKQQSLSDSQILTLARLFNEHICLIKENVGLRFVQRWLKSFVPERASPILHGPNDKTTFSNNPGFITHKYLNVTGYVQPHLSRSNVGTFLLVEVSLTTNTNSNTCSARNPDGPHGQIRNYRIYWHRMGSVAS